MCRNLRLCHWGPLTALGIIKWVTLVTVYCNTMYWPPADSAGGMTNMVIFLLFSTLTTFHFFCAAFDGPGYVPFGWKPSSNEDTKYLQYCDACEGYKAPRSHHCRRCGRCVMKMDHHCPWINNCVGHFNHGHFIAFLFFAVIGCAHAAFILSMSLYYGLNRSWYHVYGTGHEPVVTLTLFTLLVIMFGLGLSIGVVLAVGALCFFQLRAAWKNQTGIEDWILEKAECRRKGTEEVFRNPYNLGKWRNLRQVVTFTCAPEGDGIEWRLAEGCGQYDLTREQLDQKAEKRMRTREYQIIKDYSGSWFPLWSQGWRVACRPPYTDESRIALTIGDTVRVTRWKRHWMYGDRVVTERMEGRVRHRGWFPRQCAVEVVDQDLEEEVVRRKENKKTR